MTELLIASDYNDEIKNISGTESLIDGHNTMSKIVNQVSEDLLKQVLRQTLKREPTIEDAKHCTLASYTHQNGPSYSLYYKGMMLGKIEMDIEFNHNTLSSSFVGKFTPAS